MTLTVAAAGDAIPFSRRPAPLRLRHRHRLQPRVGHSGELGQGDKQGLVRLVNGSLVVRDPIAPPGRPARWWWGTSRLDGDRDTHMVHPDQSESGLCDLRIDNLFARRPPEPEALCTFCCVQAIAAVYPVVELWPLLPEVATDDPAVEGASEQTVTMHAITAHDLRAGEHVPLTVRFAEEPTVELRAVSDDRAAAEGAAATRALYSPEPPSPELLEQVLRGLRNL